MLCLIQVLTRRACKHSVHASTSTHWLLWWYHGGSFVWMDFFMVTFFSSFLPSSLPADFVFYFLHFFFSDGVHWDLGYYCLNSPAPILLKQNAIVSYDLTDTKLKLTRIGQRLSAFWLQNTPHACLSLSLLVIICIPYQLYTFLLSSWPSSLHFSCQVCTKSALTFFVGRIFITTANAWN